MEVVRKRFSIALDIKRATANREFEVVEGDNGNILVVTLTDDGAPIDLTGCLICAIFSKSTGTAQQDNEGHGITLDEGETNKLEIQLYTTSFAPGLVECELQVYSGVDNKTLVTSAKLNFKCRRGIANDDTILATNEWPLLVDMLDRVEQGEETRNDQEGIRQANESGRIERDAAFSVWEEYDPGKAYVPLNKVSYQGSSYVCIAETTGNPPLNPAYWLLIAAKGDQGIQGPQGEKGDTGAQGPKGDKGDKGDPGLDGTGAGDMEKATYDADDNGIVDDAERLGGQLPAAYLSQTFSATLDKDEWSGAGPYTQTVDVVGVTAAMQPIADIMLSANTETAKEEETNWAYISKIDMGTGEITATCNSSKPLVDLNIRLMEVP